MQMYGHTDELFSRYFYPVSSGYFRGMSIRRRWGFCKQVYTVDIGDRTQLLIGESNTLAHRTIQSDYPGFQLQLRSSYGHDRVSGGSKQALSTLQPSIIQSLTINFPGYLLTLDKSLLSFSVISAFISLEYKVKRECSTIR